MLGDNSNTFIITGGNWAEDIVKQTSISNRELKNKIRGITLFHGIYERKCKDLKKDNGILVKGTDDKVQNLLNYICSSLK